MRRTTIAILLVFPSFLSAIASPPSLPKAVPLDDLLKVLRTNPTSLQLETMVGQTYEGWIEVEDVVTGSYWKGGQEIKQPKVVMTIDAGDTLRKLYFYVPDTQSALRLNIGDRARVRARFTAFGEPVSVLFVGRPYKWVQLEDTEILEVQKRTEAEPK
jgi:hypothetical protein